MEETRSVETTASPESIWRIWSDAAHWPQWNTFVKSMEVSGPFALGATAKMTTPQGTHQVTVTEFEPGRGFALNGPMMPGIAMTFRCRIEPLAEGSRISQGISMSGPLAGPFFAMMGKQIADSFVPILQALAAHAEKS